MKPLSAWICSHLIFLASHSTLPSLTYLRSFPPALYHRQRSGYSPSNFSMTSQLKIHVSCRIRRTINSYFNFIFLYLTIHYFLNCFPLFPLFSSISFFSPLSFFLLCVTVLKEIKKFFFFLLSSSVPLLLLCISLPLGRLCAPFRCFNISSKPMPYCSSYFPSPENWKTFQAYFPPKVFLLSSPACAASSWRYRVAASSSRPLPTLTVISSFPRLCISMCVFRLPS